MYEITNSTKNFKLRYITKIMVYMALKMRKGLCEVYKSGNTSVNRFIWIKPIDLVKSDLVKVVMLYLDKRMNVRNKGV